MLMLVNQEGLDARIATSVHRLSAWSEDAYNAGRSKEGELSVYGSNAIIQVQGPLSYKYDFWTWLMDGSSYTGIIRQLVAAENAEEVSQIVMVFDSPGGEVTGCRIAADAIRQCRKPVVGFIDPEAASAGLWLASQCSRLVSMRDGWIGSLGVQTMAVSMADYYKEKGIDIRVIRSEISPKKNAGMPYEPMDDAAVQERQTRVDKWGEIFLADVAAGRKQSREYALEHFGQGKMLDADEALNVGLIDSIGTLADVVIKSSSKPRKMSSTRRVW
jgi:capsid assembly protease